MNLFISISKETDIGKELCKKYFTVYFGILEMSYCVNNIFKDIIDETELKMIKNSIKDFYSKTRNSFDIFKDVIIKNSEDIIKEKFNEVD